MSKRILLGTRRGMFVASKDSGNWRVSEPLLAGQPIYCASADTRGDVTLFAGRNDAHWGPGIRYSRDDGATWSESEKQPRFAEDSNLAVEAIWQIVPGGADQPGVLYAGVAPAGLFKSEDGGKTWNEMEGLSKHPTRAQWIAGAGGMCVHSILVDPKDSAHLVVGISAAGVFESVDGGVTWELVNQGLPLVLAPDAPDGSVGSCIHKIAFAPSVPGQPERIYQQNHMGLFKRDGRGRWESIQNNQPFSFGFPLAAHPRDRERAYVIPLEDNMVRAPKDGKLTVYATRDGGKSWDPLRKGLPGNAYNGVLRDAFTIDTGSPAGLYFGTNGGEVFASPDEGESWEMVAETLPPIYSVRVV